MTNLRQRSYLLEEQSFDEFHNVPNNVQHIYVWVMYLASKFLFRRTCSLFDSDDSAITEKPFVHRAKTPISYEIALTELISDLLQLLHSELPGSDRPKRRQRRA